ncbi:MAG: zinc ribbon domain-containing protein [Gammaproteobacteria bacterium]|nr:zinc ribbon domain-containing protein [Gammaproteobacteria bacterium]
MPTYDYRCDANGRTLEARHSMNRKIRTWGELCALLEIEPGATASDVPVRKVFSGGHVVKSENLGSGEAPPCQGGTGPSCGRGMCGI